MLEDNNVWWRLKREVYSKYQHYRKLRVKIIEFERIACDAPQTVVDKIMDKIPKLIERSDFEQLNKYYCEIELEILKEKYNLGVNDEKTI